MQYKLQKVGQYLSYLILLTPLFIVPNTLWEFVFIRNIIFYCLTAILLFVSILYIYKKKEDFSFRVNILFWVILGFVVVRLISGFFGVNPNTSFFGTQPRMDGDIGYLALFGWFLSLLVFFDGREDWKKFFKVSALVAMVVSFFAVVQPFFPQEGFLAGKGGIAFFNYRLIGTLGNPIFLAGYLLPHIFLAFYLFLKEDGHKLLKYFWLGATALFIFMVLLTQTRGAVLSLILTGIVLLIVYGLFFLKKNKKKVSNLALFGIPFLGAIFIAFLSSGFFARLRDLSLSSTTVVTRLLLWKIAISGFLDKWLFGWGSENFAYVFSKFYNPELLRYSFYETWADKPHNQLLEVATTTGAIGLIFYLAIFGLLLYFIYKLATKNKEKFLSYLLIGGAIISFLGHIFFAFDTVELRIIIFAIFAFVIFEMNKSFNNTAKLSVSPVKGIFIAFFALMLLGLSWIGIKTISASVVASSAREAIVVNDYKTAKESLKKLQDYSGPYSYGNWENISDVILNSDASGRLPASVSRALLPIMIEELGVAVKESPNNFSYHYRLGQMYNLAGIYINRDYFDDSKDALMRAKEISPDRQVADLLLAQVYYYMRDLDSAVKLLKDLIEKDPNVPHPYWYLGILYNASADYENAFAYMSTAIDNGYGSRTLGEDVMYVNVLGRFNQYERMVPAYLKIISQDKKNPAWWASLASVYLELEQYNEARDATRQAIFLDPTFGDEGENFLQTIENTQYGNSKF